MTRDEIKAMLEEIGVKVEELSERAIETIQEKVESEKEKLHTETRRKCANFGLWYPLSHFLSEPVPVAFSFNR